MSTVTFKQENMTPTTVGRLSQVVIEAIQKKNPRKIVVGKRALVMLSHADAKFHILGEGTQLSELKYKLDLPKCVVTVDYTFENPLEVKLLGTKDKDLGSIVLELTLNKMLLCG